LRNAECFLAPAEAEDRIDQLLAARGGGEYLFHFELAALLLRQFSRTDVHDRAQDEQPFIGRDWR
jgi:hypothetical protein